jgi:hypothetical protein
MSPRRKLSGCPEAAFRRSKDTRLLGSGQSDCSVLFGGIGLFSVSVQKIPTHSTERYHQSKQQLVHENVRRDWTLKTSKVRCPREYETLWQSGNNDERPYDGQNGNCNRD